MQKAIRSLNPLSSFLSFLVFQILLTVQFVIVLGLLLAIFVSDSSGSDLLESIVKVFGLYLLAVIAILAVAPLWGKKLIGFWTDTTPRYWRIAGLGVWLPALLYILFNIATSAIAGNPDGSVLLISSIIFQLAVIWFVSSLYLKKASGDAARARFSTDTKNRPESPPSED